MKKCLLIFMMVIFGASVANAAPAELSYNYLSRFNVLRFEEVYMMLNGSIKSSKEHNGRYYTKFEDVWEYAVKSVYPYKPIKNGIVYDTTFKQEVMYEKLKDNCQNYPSNPSPATACAKLTIDVNGFSSGTNKYISDSTTTEAKDRFILYLYSNGARAASGSIEEMLLYLDDRMKLF